MAYYIRLNSGVGSGGNGVLHAVHLGHQPLSPLNIHAVVGGAQGKSSGQTSVVKDLSFDIEQALTIGSASSGAGAGKVTFNPFSVTKKVDNASPVFFKTMVPGKNFAQVSIDFFSDEGPEELTAFTINLTNAVIKGVQPIRQSGAAKQSLKSSELTRIQFSFQNIQFIKKSGGGTNKDDWKQ